jgi:hypothetical protein
MEPIYPVPFEAIGVVDFNTVPIVQGQEYEITAVSADGTRWQTAAPDGKPGWFPAKYCAPIPSQPQRVAQYAQPQYEEPQYAQQQYAPAPQATLQRTVSYGDEARRREREELRRQEEAKKSSLRQRLESKTVRAPNNVEDVLQDLLDEEDSDDGGGPVQTYAATKGYLAGTSAFDADLSTYGGHAAYEPEPAPAPVAYRQPVQQQQPQQQVQKPGMYFKVGAVEDAPVQSYAPPEDGPWRCSTCGTVQAKHLGKCGMCGSAKATTAAPVYHPEAAGERPFEENWKCPRCSVPNDRSSLKCNMCGADRPQFDPTVAKRNMISATKQPPAKNTRPGAGQGPKKKIISKASSGVELEYAKKVDVYNYKSGSAAVPGHGASY